MYLRQIQMEVFHQLQRLSFGFYNSNESGDLMSRITNDTSTIQQAIGFALVQVASGSLLIVWIAYNMLTITGLWPIEPGGAAADGRHTVV